jgi:hypothetical protein
VVCDGHRRAAGVGTGHGRGLRWTSGRSYGGPLLLAGVTPAPAVGAGQAPPLLRRRSHRSLLCQVGAWRSPSAGRSPPDGAPPCSAWPATPWPGRPGGGGCLRARGHGGGEPRNGPYRARAVRWRLPRRLAAIGSTGGPAMIGLGPSVAAGGRKD